MSNEAITAVSKSEIKPSGRKFVMMALADYADEEWSCFPSVEQLAQYTCQGEKTVRDHLSALEAEGIISRERHRRDDGTLGRYRFFIHRRNLPVAKIAIGEKRPKPPANFAAHNPHRNPQELSLRSSSAREQVNERFSTLWSIFPLRPGQSRKTAKVAFSKLSETEQLACLNGARQYAARFEADRQAKGESLDRALGFVKALVRWIEERGWEAFDSAAAQPLVVIRPEQPEWALIEKMRGQKLFSGGRGTATVLQSEIDAARAAERQIA